MPQPQISEETVTRRLAFYLFDLAEGARIAVVRELNLVTEEMEELNGRELFVAIIDEARKRGELTQLWHAVASRSQNMPVEPTSGINHA